MSSEGLTGIELENAVQSYIAKLNSQAARNLLRSVEKASAGLKFKDRNSRLKNPNQIATWFSLAGKRLTAKFNAEDLAVLQEEAQIQADAKNILSTYGSIDKVPAEEIIKFGFSRILLNKKWKMFKSLSSGEGAVIID